MKTTPENQTADGSPSGAASCSASPGPWQANLGAEDDPDRWIVVADNGTRPYHIATVENGQPGDTLDTEKATADLIAAAPELLECLIHLAERDWFKEGYDGISGHVTCSMPAAKVRNAIRKALGQNDREHSTSTAGDGSNPK